VAPDLSRRDSEFTTDSNRHRDRVFKRLVPENSSTLNATANTAGGAMISPTRALFQVTKDLFTHGMHYNGGMTNNITFDEGMRTGARCSTRKTSLMLRAPFPRYRQLYAHNLLGIRVYRQVNGDNLLRVRIQGKIYSVGHGFKDDEEARRMGLEWALKLLYGRAQASSGPR
jgi:hypothetical protein